MNWLDIVIICLIAAGVLKGFYDGFIRQMAALGALIAAIYFCSKGAIFLQSVLIKTGWFNEYSLNVASYIGAFILILASVLLVGGLVHRLLKDSPLNLFNQLLGAAFALIVTLLLISLTLQLIDGVDRHSRLLTKRTKEESLLYHQVKMIIPTIYPSDLFVWKK